MTSIEPMVVLVGGLAMRASDFDHLIKTLAKRGVAAVSYDNLSVGEGPRLADASILHQATHGWSMVDSIVNADAAIHLFGISMGGMIASTMATLAPERIRSLILGATSANTTLLPAVSNDLYSFWTNIRSPEDLYKCVEIAFGETNLTEQTSIVNDYFTYRQQKGNNQTRREFIAQLDAIRSFDGPNVYEALKLLPFDKTLVSGDEDRLFPAEHAAYISKFVQEHIVLAKTGHMLHLENPGGLADVIAARVKA